MNSYDLVCTVLEANENNKENEKFPWKKHAAGTGFAAAAGTIGFGIKQPQQFREAKDDLKSKLMKTEKGRTLWKQWIRSSHYKIAKRKCFKAAMGGASVAAIYAILVYAFHAFSNYVKKQSGELNK